MKKLLLYINVIHLFTISTYSQTLSDKMIYSVIGQYIEEHVDTSVTQNVYIKVVSEKKLRGFSLGDIKIILFDSRKERRYYRALTNSNGLFHILRIRHLSNDTIDFSFSRCQVMKEGRGYGIMVESGGDMGYIPYVRFIYSKKDQSWSVIASEELKKNAIYDLPKALKVHSCAK